MAPKPGILVSFLLFREPNENKCLAKLNVTNDIYGLLLFSQPKSELAFTFPLLTSVCGLFW